MRLFTGVEIPPDILDQLDRTVAKLRPLARIKWSPAKNMHITTKFIGDWPAERLEELVEALAAVPPVGEIPVEFRGLGWFPNPRAPRVFYAGIDGGERLPMLAAATEAATARLGVAPENRDYAPHLTLARIKQRVDLTSLQKAAAEWETDAFGAFTAHQFHLYESELQPTGSIYHKRAAFSVQQS